MYKLGIKAAGDPAKNKKIIDFFESLGYKNTSSLTGNVFPSTDSVYTVENSDNKIYCIVNPVVECLFDNIEEAKEYINQHKEIMDKEVKIQVPEGYEIDKENSTFECIKFKKKQLTYDDIAKKLFKSEGCFFILSEGEVEYVHEGVGSGYKDPNNCTSRKQAEKLLAINKLMNVAKYLNKGWIPDWNSGNEPKYSIVPNYLEEKFIIYTAFLGKTGTIYFKTKELAEQAIQILGKDTITLAICDDY